MTVFALSASVFFVQRDGALGKRIQVIKILNCMTDVTFTTFLANPHTFGVWVRGIANSHSTMDKNKRVFADEFETFQTESLGSLIRWVIR